MSLKTYWSKRNFSTTPEPKGELLKTRRHRFVVQSHYAKHFHQDFRLEMEGVLKSWAVPKGVPEKVGKKVLALSVEDHPIDYLNFSGIIPKGLYGAGRVEVFDKGKYELIEKAENRIVFKLKGKKLKGEYTLLKFKKPNQWLLFKIK
ncbi:MAG: DNA polymerase ligase N-terminal domain-containing protein [Patescibacteria group bacterium]|nr:DNA polymerase ligase N-terminal domain-containing protein [Patescibacteria group bacterium]